MMHQTLLKSGVKKHKGMLIGIFVLIFLVSLALGTVLTVWTNSASYLKAELNRVGFGTLTAWVSNVSNTDKLAADIAAQKHIAQVNVQSLIFASYNANGHESDSEGQLIVSEPYTNSYRFFTNNLSGYQVDAPDIASGEVYISPSLITTFNIKLGDIINFSIARNGVSIPLKVKGFYEDPFMGSSMIGMKGFIISEADTLTISQLIQSSGIDALAREGAMLHIFSEETSAITAAELNSLINQNTDLSQYTDFVHSADAISGFMLILQNAFSSLLVAFVLILLIVVLVALGHGIVSNIAADYVSLGILKAVGFTSTKLRQIQLLQYATAILPSMLLGLALTEPLSRFVSNQALSTTGVMIPTKIPWSLCLFTFTLILVIICAFIILKTSKIKSIDPMNAIRGEVANATIHAQSKWKISGIRLNLSMAIRQLITGKNKYISACFVAMLLVFFSSTIGRIDSWLGADGKGMMDAFNPADHDIGVQMFGQHTLTDAQALTSTYTDITNSYQLAMVSAAINGIDYTANVITQPERFHILEGQTSTTDDEIVITEFVAADLGVYIGDVVNVTGDISSSEFTISGIYSCANNMGDSIGMSREGYLRISQENSQIWCDHYFLADTSLKSVINQALTTEFGGDVQVHENTWPGLFGIISAMRALIVFMYAMVALFTLIITAMTASKVLAAEKKDIGIYKAIGFTNHQLQISFALRFGIVAIIGSIFGIVLSASLTDLMVSTVMKLAGISNFASNPNILAIAFPAIFVTLLFLVFAYFTTGSLKRTDLTVLMTE